MAINGRINVDVLFHDTDGTTSLKVVSLEDSTEYTSGKVAVVTGTASNTPQFLWSTNPAVAPIQYRNSAGNLVAFTSAASITRLAFSASSGGLLVFGSVAVRVRANEVTLLSPEAGASDIVFTASGLTASYTLVLYGE